LRYANIILLPLKDAADVAWTLLNIERLIDNYTDFKAEKFNAVVNENIEEFKEAIKVIKGIEVVESDNAIKLLIEEENKNITDVAFLSGFNNISNFNRQFKLIKGKSPSSYLKLRKF